MKTGGNIAPANRKNSRRFQAGASTDRVVGLGVFRATRTIFCPSRIGISASAISESNPRPMKCQMNIADTANLGITLSQPARDILATMTAIKPAIIAIIKTEMITRPIP